MSRSGERHRPRRELRRNLVVGGVVFGLLALGLGGYFGWTAVVNHRRMAEAEQLVRSGLDRWRGGEPFEQLKGPDVKHYFSDPSFVNKMRPLDYEITGVRSGRGGVCEVSVTLTFAGGPETRVYDAIILPEKGTSSVHAIASEDVSNTESHARPILRAWLDTWVAGGTMTAFKQAHPEAAAAMTTDTTWAVLSSTGKRLVRYDITSVTTVPAPGLSTGFRFTVTAIIEEQGRPETRILHYDLYKDRTLSQGRWSVMGM